MSINNKFHQLFLEGGSSQYYTFSIFYLGCYPGLTNFFVSFNFLDSRDNLDRKEVFESFFKSNLHIFVEHFSGNLVVHHYSSIVILNEIKLIWKDNIRIMSDKGLCCVLQEEVLGSSDVSV